MSKLFRTFVVVVVGMAYAPFVPAQSNQAPDAVTVVIQINLQPGTSAQAAMSPMGDMRTLIRKQPGYLGGESLQNNNPSNTPAFVHVTRWASLKYWEQVYQSPEFSKLNAAGAKQYNVVISAFKQLQ